MAGATYLRPIRPNATPVLAGPNPRNGLGWTNGAKGLLMMGLLTMTGERYPNPNPKPNPLLPLL